MQPDGFKKPPARYQSPHANPRFLEIFDPKALILLMVQKSGDHQLREVGS